MYGDFYVSYGLYGKYIFNKILLDFQNIIVKIQI